MTRVISFSVVIPTIGRPSLESSVVSAARQGTAPDLIVLSDNSPTPIGKSRIDKLAQTAHPVPIRICSLPPLAGPAFSRNVGAWEAKSSYVAFLDDDDEMSPDYLSVVASHIARTGDEVVYGTWFSRRTGQKEGSLDTLSPHRWLASAYEGRNPGFGGSNVVARRELFLRLGGFPVSYVPMEDRAFAMIAIRSGAAVGHASGALTMVGTPEGPRVNTRGLEKWLAGLRLTVDFWNDVPLRSRLQALWRLGRSLPSNLRRGLPDPPGLGAAEDDKPW